ncbi:MAG: trypsin-like peptidase domain-containing protein [Epsilonproteobacteria bacterium]|nr:trypsin-like peptidase domain-containing protein [Campylobacterota bacterium]
MSDTSNKSTFLIKSTKNSSFGTGFCVYKDEKGSFLVTAAHVVNACGKENLQVDVHNATLLHISNDDDIIDLALIYVEGLTDTVALKLSDEIAQEGDAFGIDGFRPHKSDQYRQEPLQGSIKKVYPILSRATNEKVTTYDLKIGDEDTIEKGYSGSAVVSTQTGLVIAIATDRKTNGKQAYATPATYLKSIWEEMPETLFESNQMNNPYKGLHSFEYEDRENYYGRETESKKIAQTIKTTKLFTLLGASGSGKSSLLFAGIVPALEEDGVEIVDFRPFGNPFKSLASVFISTLYPDELKQMKKERELTNDLQNGDIEAIQLVEKFQEKRGVKKLYIIIDQFEELFTLTKEQKDRNSFLDQLLSIINSELNVTLIISMRADFLAHLSYYEPFISVYDAHPNKTLSLLNTKSLQEVIEQPALKYGVTFQDGLVDRIIGEIEGQAGQLPLLEFALDQLWVHKEGRTISFDTLKQIGSISKSISHYADSAYSRYPNIENSIKRVFINLVTIGDETDTKKRAKLDEFKKEDIETITLLANERLIVTNKDEIEIVHEALIREWQELKDWINEYRDFLQWQERVREDRSFYEENGEKKEDLLRDSKLLVAKDFLGSFSIMVSKAIFRVIV